MLPPKYFPTLSALLILIGLFVFPALGATESGAAPAANQVGASVSTPEEPAAGSEVPGSGFSAGYPIEQQSLLSAGPLAVTSSIELEAELGCDGKGYDLAAPHFAGLSDGEGAGRAIGFKAEADFILNAVGIRGDLVEISFDVVIYDSPDGHSAGDILATFSGTTGGKGNAWNVIPVFFKVTAGKYYVVNWRPGKPVDWAKAIEFYRTMDIKGDDDDDDDGDDEDSSYSKGPVTILESFEGSDAKNPNVDEFARFAFCISGNCNVAVLGSPGDPAWNEDVQKKIISTGIFKDWEVTTVNIAKKTPTLAELKQYAAVLVYSDSPGYQNSTALGDNLADYVDWGGGVVVAVFSNASIPFNGRFDTDNYWVVKPSGQKSGKEERLGTVYEPDHPILDGVTSFSGGSFSFHMTRTNIEAGATRIADWTDGRPLVATKIINGIRRADLGFFPPSSDTLNGFWKTSTDGALLMANALDWVKRPNCEYCEFEGFSDPLGDWVSGWFYQNTNIENFYTASGNNCDPNYRGIEKEGIFLSDDRGCGDSDGQNPVTINFLNSSGDNASTFSIDHYTCVPGVTFNVYDRDGAVYYSEPLPADCANYTNLSIILTNGISAFEYDHNRGGQAGNTAIDNIEICFFDICECDLNDDGECNADDRLMFITDWGRTDCSPADPCDCDLNFDGNCDGRDWNAFILGWSRADCPALSE